MKAFRGSYNEEQDSEGDKKRVQEKIVYIRMVRVCTRKDDVYNFIPPDSGFSKDDVTPVGILRIRML